ncbi:MAG TPA: hypothetical protein DD658_09150 [Deltaproteobacteria bacterium]|nr:hypothetical protein [Deltaproteobacteria bacterium]
MPDLADLFTPIKLRNTILRNRIVQSAHITGYVETEVQTKSGGLA